MSSDAQKRWYERNAMRIATERQELRLAVLDRYGSVCQCCGEAEQRFLTLDHVNDDGTPDRAKHGSGNAFYRRLLDVAIRTDLQVLCFNCNHGRKLLGICPHQVSGVLV